MQQLRQKTKIAAPTFQEKEDERAYKIEDSPNGFEGDFRTECNEVLIPSRLAKTLESRKDFAQQRNAPK